jgi:Flp pilus assembly protein TadD
MPGFTRIEMPVQQPNSPNHRLACSGQGLILRILACSLSFHLIYLTVNGQALWGQSAADDTMGAHYDAAQKAQVSGDLAQSEVEYEKFIADALRRLAGRDAAGGDLKTAIVLLEEALELTPNVTDLRLDYAKAFSASGDLASAKDAAEDVLTLEPKNSKAHLVLGDILSKMGDDTAATLHFVTSPSFCTTVNERVYITDRTGFFVPTLG